MTLRRGTSGNTTTTTVYLEGHELTRTVAGPVVGNVTRYYSIGGATVASRTAGGLTWLFGNHQGTISRATADASGATTANFYDPFGGRLGLTPDTITTNRGFIGQIEDNTTGLVYLNNRYYDPTIGRFASIDPLAFPDSPQTLNPYSYARNNPTRYSDPSGLCFEFADAASLGVDASKINCATIATADRLNETTSFAHVPINVWSAADAGIVEIIEKNLPAFGSDNWLGGVSSQIGAKYDMVARAQAARIAGQSLGFLDLAVVGLALAPIAIGGVIQGAAWLGKPLGAAVACAATDGSICPRPLPGATNTVDDLLASGRQVSGRFPQTGGVDEVLVRRGADGSVTHYQVYGHDGLPIKRVDLTGRAQGGIPTPHVVDFERHVNTVTGEVFVRPSSTVRPAPGETPGAE